MFKQTGNTWARRVIHVDQVIVLAKGLRKARDKMKMIKAFYPSMNTISTETKFKQGLDRLVNDQGDVVWELKQW